MRNLRSARQFISTNLFISTKLLYEAVFVFYLSCRDSRGAVENCSMTQTTALMPEGHMDTG